MATTWVLCRDRSVGQNPSYCGKVGSEAVGKQPQRRRLPARHRIHPGEHDERPLCGTNLRRQTSKPCAVRGTFGPESPPSRCCRCLQTEIANVANSRYVIAGR